MYRLCDGIEFLKSLPDKSVDGIFTDPPWKMKGPCHDTKYNRARGIRLRGATQWRKLITEMTDEAARILNPETGRCFIWLGMTSLGEGLRAVNSLEYRFTFFVGWMRPRYVAGFELLLNPILYFAPRVLPGQWPAKDQPASEVFIIVVLQASPIQFILVPVPLKK
ncbi:MAG: hypothetical protein ACFFCW_19885 [Candidatus Hodarchaeota archaeon]